MAWFASLSRTLAATACVLAGCASPSSSSVPQLAADSSKDQERYDRCNEPAGVRAYDAAVKKIGEHEPLAALPFLREAILHCPELVRAHVTYQDLALDLERAAEGQQAAAEMRGYYAGLQDPGNSPVVPYLKARLLPDPAEQQKAFEAVLRRDSRFAPARLSLGRIWRSVGNLVEASTELQNAVAASPRLAEAHLELAEVLVQLGRSADALAYFQNYLRLNPSDRLAKLHYVELLIYDMGKPTEARKAIEELAAQDPGDVNVLIDQAALEWKTSHGEKARDLYIQVLRLDRTQSRAALNLGNLYFEVLSRGTDPKEVKEAYTKARKAYVFYRNMRRHEGVLDAIDYHMGVPYRIKWIEEKYPELAKDQVPPTLEDL